MIIFKIRGITPFCGNRQPNYYDNPPAFGGMRDRYDDWNACSYGEQLGVCGPQLTMQAAESSFAGHADV